MDSYGSLSIEGQVYWRNPGLIWTGGISSYCGGGSCPPAPGRYGWRYVGQEKEKVVGCSVVCDGEGEYTEFC